MNKNNNNKLDFFIKTYLENRPNFYAFIRPLEAILFEKNIKLLKHPILDFGCGDGFFANLVFGKNNIDIGLDLKSNKRVQEAEKNKIYKMISLYDGQFIPFLNDSVASVISNCVLEHIPSLKLSLKEINRILKPGGFFLTTVMTDKWENYFFGKKILGNLYVNFMRKKQQHYNLLSEKAWKKMFEKKGFKIIKTIPYLSSAVSEKIDLYHYLSLPSLISYILFKKWNLFSPNKKMNITVDKIKKLITLSFDHKNSSAVFFVLQKI